MASRDDLERWVQAYETAWRSPGTERLAAIFTDDAVYLHSPYARPIVGLPAIAEMWEAERDGPDEEFAMEREIVAVEGDTGVVRVLVRYGEPVRQEYRDLSVGPVRRSGPVQVVRGVALLAWPGMEGRRESAVTARPPWGRASSMCSRLAFTGWVAR